MDKILKSWYNNEERRKYTRIAMLGMGYEELSELSKTNNEASILLDRLMELNNNAEFVALLTEEEEKRFMENGLKKEGYDEGISTAKKDIAILMLKNSEDIDKIIKYTGLSKEEINLLNN